MAYVPKILSGLDFLDQTWDGMYQGGAYMCYGQPGSGRGLLGMLFLKMGVSLNEKCLFFSPGRHQDWLIQANSVQFDLQKAHDDGLAKLMWIPQVGAIQQVDERSAMRAIHNLGQFARVHQPARVLINDFVPFLQFRSLERFRHTFANMLQEFEAIGATLLLMMNEATNEPSKHVIDLMKHQMTGTIHIGLNDEESALNRRQISLLPGLGHVEHKVIPDWELPKGAIPNTPVEKSARKPPQRRTRKTKTRKLGSVSDSSSTDQIDFSAGGAPQPNPDGPVDPEAFYTSLRRCFARRDAEGTPFLLIAIRVEEKIRTNPEELMEALLPSIGSILHNGDDLLVDQDRRRLIILMPGKTTDDIQNFFDLIQQYLEAHHPPQAESLLNQVSAIVVPDGRPFVQADDFLSYALDSS